MYELNVILVLLAAIVLVSVRRISIVVDCATNASLLFVFGDPSPLNVLFVIEAILLIPRQTLLIIFFSIFTTLNGKCFLILAPVG